MRVEKEVLVEKSMGHEVQHRRRPSSKNSFMSLLFGHWPLLGNRIICQMFGMWQNQEEDTLSYLGLILALEMDSVTRPAA